MAVAGGRRRWSIIRAGSRIAITAIGFTPIAAGIGFRIIRGAGRRSITDAGFTMRAYGWCWAPDTVWGPSWVTWRYSGDYCGWAPLPPVRGLSGRRWIHLQRRGGQRQFRFRSGRGCVHVCADGKFLRPASVALSRCAGTGDADLQQHDGHQQLQRGQPQPGFHQPRH